MTACSFLPAATQMIYDMNLQHLLHGVTFECPAIALQEKQKGDNPVLIRIDTRAGHGAGKSTQQVIDEQTDTWSFLFHNIGLVPKY